MKKAVLYVIFLTVATFLFMKCGSGVKEFDSFDDPLLLNTNDHFILKIKSNHSTGYEWHEKSTIDTSLLELKFVDYKIKNPEEDGGGGWEYWHFVARKRGESSVQLYYMRPYEDIVDSMDVKIIISD